LNWKIFSFFLTILAAILVLPYSYKYWPPGKAQDYAFIWLNGEQISNLIEIADAKGYQSIFWCPERPNPRVIKRSGEQLKDWENDADFREFTDAVKESKLFCFHGKIHDGRWLLFGSNDFDFVGENENQKRRIINRYHFTTDKTVKTGCEENIDEDTQYKTCTSNMFGNWYVREDFITTPKVD
jgi:hypothetical protein